MDFKKFSNFFVLVFAILNLINLTSSVDVSMIFDQKSDLNSCTTNLANNDVDFQVNDLTVTFVVTNNLTYACLNFVTIQLTDTTSTPVYLTFFFSSTVARNNYLISMNGLSNINFQLKGTAIIFSPVILNSQSCGASCEGYNYNSCVSYCTAAPVDNYSYDLTINQSSEVSTITSLAINT